MGVDTDEFMQSLTDEEQRQVRLMGILWKRYHMTMPEILAMVMKQHDDNLLHGVQQIVENHDEKRTKKTLSFVRRVLDALWSGASQAHALLQKLFKE